MSLSLTDLRKMSAKDLLQEIAKQRAQCAKTKMGIRLAKEKDTAKLRKQRRNLAQMLTILGEKDDSQAKELKSTEKTSTIASPEKTPARSKKRASDSSSKSS